jgi:hypothetical protein
MRSVRKAFIGAAVLTIAAATAACGGGGSHGGGSLPTQSQPAAFTSGTAVLVIPNATAATAKTRRAQFISASAVSVGVAVNGGTATVANISATSPLCKATSNGRSCTIPVSAPSGNATFTFTFYDGANGSGNVLGTGSASQTVAIGTPFTLSVAVSGVVASLAVSVPVIDVGPTSVPVTVTAKDIDGNIIVGPAAYGSPITLTNSDTTGTLALSTTTIAAPNSAVTLAYTGGTLPSAATIAATSSGVPPAASTSASVLPLNYFPSGFERDYAMVSDSTVVGGFGGPSSGQASQSVTGGATFGGIPNVQAITQYNSNGFMGVFSLIETSTMYAALENGAYDFLGYTYQPPTQFQPPALSLGPPYACSGVSFQMSETQTYTQGFIDPLLPFAATPSTFIAAYSGSSTSTEIPGSTAGCGGFTPPTVTVTTTYSQDAAGNYTEVNSYSDGSSMTERDNADGSGSFAYAAGTSPGAGTAWDNGMAANLSAASQTVSAPAGGNVTISVTQTTSSGSQTSSGTLPASAMYPNGIPTAVWSGTSNAGAPVTSLPPQCAVTAAYAGPVVPVTLTFNRWEPAAGSVTSETLVDYLAPAIGTICELQTYNEIGALSNLALSSLPISLTGADTVVPDSYTEADSLVSRTALSNVRIRPSARPAAQRRNPFRLIGPMRRTIFS